MDIAYVSDVSYPWKKGGAEKRIYEIAERLSKNHEVTIYTSHWWKENQKRIKKNNIQYVAISKKTPLYTKNRRSIKQALGFALNTLRIQNKHDVIDFNIFPYLHCITGKMRTLPQKNMLITWHEVWGNYWYKYLGKMGYFGKLVEKTVSKLPREIIAVSEKTQKELKEMGRSSELVPNGIDYKWIQEIEPKKKQKYDVVFVGRLIPEKNVDKLILALENTDYSAAIIGDGPKTSKLKELAEKREVDADFLGETSYRDLIGVIKSSRVFVLPSSREGFGITVIEALASGTPVLTVDEENNAAKDLIRDEWGLVVPLDPFEIKKGIDLLLKRKEKKDLGEKAKEYARDFDWDKITKKCLDIYKKFL